MIDIKPDIRNALLADANLVSLLGGERVYAIQAPNPDEYPRITMFEVYNLDQDFADNEPTSSEILIQIDVWSKANYNPIVFKTDEIVHGLGLIRYYATDLYEEKEYVYHKVLRYRTARYAT